MSEAAEGDEFITTLQTKNRKIVLGHEVFMFVLWPSRVTCFCHAALLIGGVTVWYVTENCLCVMCNAISQSYLNPLMLFPVFLRSSNICDMKIGDWERSWRYDLIMLLPTHAHKGHTRKICIDYIISISCPTHTSSQSFINQGQRENFLKCD